MGLLAIIGGSGFQTLPALAVSGQTRAVTSYGSPSAPLMEGHLSGLPVLFLARHGPGHRVPPHQINYRANLKALAEAGATQIIGLAAVGGIADDCGPGVLCVPDQLIDYTHGRPNSFYEGGPAGVVHVDFSWPYSPGLRQGLLAAASAAEVPLRDGGTYGVTQGPRLETAAEVRRLHRDGCDLVGMTAMPEAVLARELGIEYATLAFVVNWAAGLTAEVITMDEIQRQIEHCNAAVGRLLTSLAAQHAGATPAAGTSAKPD
ncbi:MAG: S-methyl-5'-thioinosine phosphorylase [Chromatiaceae bacterium]|nr:MAG: S-methyl-5'-thioinosine phosphorylase [Chromatiaceae bacterium]